VAAKLENQASSMEPTSISIASTGTAITTIGQKRKAMDYHANYNHQDNPTVHVDADATMKKLGTGLSASPLRLGTTTLIVAGTE
jgi:hypothetical protein